MLVGKPLHIAVEQGHFPVARYPRSFQGTLSFRPVCQIVPPGS